MSAINICDFYIFNLYIYCLQFLYAISIYMQCDLLISISVLSNTYEQEEEEDGLGCLKS